MTQSRAFTLSVDGLADSLITTCGIAPASDGAQGEFRSFLAQWDTGSTISAITMQVVEQCGLEQIGVTWAEHAGIDERPDEAELYLVDIGLPNQVTARNVRVVRGGFSGADVLIGMDIINAGDFAITHADGNTKFTFQIPHLADIDFVRGQPSGPAQK